jgi:hypothetical protein
MEKPREGEIPSKNKGVGDKVGLFNGEKGHRAGERERERERSERKTE